MTHRPYARSGTGRERQRHQGGLVLATTPAIGYLVMDLDREVSKEVRLRMAALETSIRTRVLY
jgi:hypothetical protein